MSEEESCRFPSESDRFLPGGTLVGLTLMTEAGFLSMFADAVVGLYILRRAIRGFRVINTPMDVYILSLVISDLIQGLGSALSVKWIDNEFVQCSSFCTAQGVIQILGETTSAMTTLAIAIHTFVKIAFRLQLTSLWIPRAAVGCIWLYVILFTGIAAGKFRTQGNEFITPSPFWCWVGDHFNTQRIFGEYLWLWLAALASIVLYIPLFILVRRLVKEGGNNIRGVHYRFLLYPISYTILVLPLSITRWIRFAHPPNATDNPTSSYTRASFVVITLYQLTGFVNVILLLYVRSQVTLLRRDFYEDVSIRKRGRQGGGGGGGGIVISRGLNGGPREGAAAAAGGGGTFIDSIQMIGSIPTMNSNAGANVNNMLISHTIEIKRQDGVGGGNGLERSSWDDYSSNHQHISIQRPAQVRSGGGGLPN